MTYEEEKNITLAKAQRIAHEMGWEVKVSDSHWQTVIEKDDLALRIHIIKDRINISGLYDGEYQYLPYHRAKTEITVSANKPIEKVVRDIKSRLLPIYQQQLAEAKIRKQKDDEYKTNKKKIMDEMASLINGARLSDCYNDSIYGYEPSLNLKWLNEYYFELKVDLTVEQVKKVLAVIYESQTTSKQSGKIK